LFARLRGIPMKDQIGNQGLQTARVDGRDQVPRVADPQVPKQLDPHECCLLSVRRAGARIPFGSAPRLLWAPARNQPDDDWLPTVCRREMHGRCHSGVVAENVLNRVIEAFDRAVNELA